MGVLGGAADLQCMCMCVCMCDCVDGCTNMSLLICICSSVCICVHAFVCVTICRLLNLDWNLEKFPDSQVLLSDTDLVKTHWLCSDVGFIFLLSCSLCVLFGLGTEHLEGQLGYFSSSLLPVLPRLRWVVQNQWFYQSGYDWIQMKSHV